MNTLKLAMRSFAKATSHLFTLAPLAIDPTVEGAPLSVPTTSGPLTPNKTKFGPMSQSVEPLLQPEEDSGIDEANGIVLDQLFSTIGRYLQSVGLGDPAPSPSATGKISGKPFTAEEVNKFVNQLTVSTNVPVTATILQVLDHSLSLDLSLSVSLSLSLS
jgi:hypothetical protein